MSTELAPASQLAYLPSSLVAPEVAAALVAFQGEIQTVSKAKTAVGSKFSYTYADLADVFEAIRKPLAKHGLGVIQRPSVRTSETGGQELALETILIHSSGASIASEVAFPIQGVDLQGLGSAITYLRRYSLLSILGIAAADDDDDGQAAQPPPSKASKPSPKKSKPSSPQATPNQIKLIWATARKHAQGLVAEGDSEAEKQLSEEIVRKAIAPLESTRELLRSKVDAVLERIAAFEVGGPSSPESG